MTILPNASAQAYLDPDLLAGVCKEVTLRPARTFRVKGLLSIDMYLIIKGEVEISIDRAAGAAPLTAGRGSPIGEIGFITGIAGHSDGHGQDRRRRSLY